MQIELIKQHCHRPSVFRDWSTGNVSGLHQLCTVTADYEGKKAHYERLGYEVASEIDMGDYRVAYINTVDDFGFYTEILAQNAQLLGLLANIAGYRRTGTAPIPSVSSPATGIGSRSPRTRKHHQLGRDVRETERTGRRMSG